MSLKFKEEFFNRKSNALSKDANRFIVVSVNLKLLTFLYDQVVRI